jgi:hypothetical protein
MESFLVAPKSFLDALEKELIESGLADEEEEEEHAGRPQQRAAP